jgi:phosphatidylglycerol lysyltransferase
MIRRTRLVRLTALLTLGSGIVNLASLLLPHWPRYGGLLFEIFPLEFRHASRILTLLIGFALVVSSFAVYRRKRRAYQAVLALAAFSVFFHLIRGPDYEQALYSVALITALLFTRREFTVRSRLPDLRGAVLRLGSVAAIALFYGVAGFWLLDARDFGVNFHWGDAIRTTARVMLLQGDVGMAPRTRHARWFLDSLDVMTYATVAYALFALYRPVVYRLRTAPRDHALAAGIVERHGRSSLDAFKTWPDKSIFMIPTHDAFLGYRVDGRYAIVLGDPVGPEERMPEIVAAFLRYCGDNDWVPSFHQTLPDFLDVYRAHDLRKIKIGDEAIVDLTRFSLDGKDMKRVRNRLHKLEGEGFRFERHESPLPEAVLAEAKRVSDAWLTIPGRRERRFTLGLFEPAYVRSTPLACVRDGSGAMAAFANLMPSYVKGEATVDLMRYQPSAPSGVMDCLFVHLFQDLRARGFGRFSLGMAPMAGFREAEEATREERAVHMFFQRLNRLFSYRGLLQFKAKYATGWEPRYMIYRNVLHLPGVALALRRVSEIKG